MDKQNVRSPHRQGGHDEQRFVAAVSLFVWNVRETNFIQRVARGRRYQPLGRDFFSKTRPLDYIDRWY